MSCLTLILVVAREPVNVKISCKRTMPQRAASKQQNTLHRSQEQHTKNAAKTTTGAEWSKNTAERTKESTINAAENITNLSVLYLCCREYN